MTSSGVAFSKGKIVVDDKPVDTIAFATYQKKTFALLLQKQRFQFAKFLAFALP